MIPTTNTTLPDFPYCGCGLWRQLWTVLDLPCAKSPSQNSLPSDLGKRSVERTVAAPGALLFLVFFAACASGTYENGEFRAGKLNYKTGGLPSSWRQVNVADANITFHHDKGGAILCNAMCDDEVDDVPLDVLTNHLLFGVEKVSELGRETISLDGRAAVRTKLNGEVDGVAVGMDLVVLKKDNCTFDFQLLASPGAIDARRTDFEAFFKGFVKVKK